MLRLMIAHGMLEIASKSQGVINCNLNDHGQCEGKSYQVLNTSSQMQSLTPQSHCLRSLMWYAIFSEDLDYPVFTLNRCLIRSSFSGASLRWSGRGSASTDFGASLCNLDVSFCLSILTWLVTRHSTAFRTLEEITLHTTLTSWMNTDIWYLVTKKSIVSGLDEQNTFKTFVLFQLKCNAKKETSCCY